MLWCALLVYTSQTPLPLAEEGALAGKSTLSLTLSHEWERGQTEVCSVSVFLAKISCTTLDCTHHMWSIMT
jgi:hypothetical protein